jgi:raffinose/stachyose/melibiose transport system permease protein
VTGLRPMSLRSLGLRSLGRGSRATVAAVVVFLFVSPIYLTLVNAFKPTDDVAASPAALPVPPSLDNLRVAWGRPDRLIQSGLLNSVVVTSFTVAFVVPLAAALSFYLARRARRLRAIALVVLAAGLMIPPQTLLLPTIRILTRLGLDHSFPGLILSNIGGGYLSFAVFVYTGFMRAVPDEVVEAAHLDGASDLRAWWSIVLPLVRPATATVAIFLSLWTWNDFLNPLFILGPLEGQTITTGIYLTIGQYTVDYGQLFGIMFLAAVIPVAGYLALQKQFMAGLTAGSGR